MNYIYAYEVIAFAMLLVVTISYLTKKWLILYKNIFYVVIQFSVLAVIAFDFIARCLNNDYNKRYIICNIVSLALYGIVIIIVVFYLTLQDSEPYIVNSSRCFSHVGFNKVISEKMLYHKKFFCLSICICNIESVSEYCQEEEICEIHKRLGGIMHKIGGNCHVYQIHSSEYVIITDTEKKVEEMYNSLRVRLHKVMRINNKNISLFYRYFVISGEDANYNFNDFMRIMISMKKMAVDMGNDHAMLTFTGNVRKSIERELDIISIINDIVNTGSMETEYRPIYNIQNGIKITSLEVRPKLVTDGDGHISIDELWTVSRQIGCSKDINSIFWKSVLEFVVSSKIFEKGIDMININISSYHIASEDICMEYLELLREYKIPEKRIVLEFTIDAVITDDAMKRSIEFFRKHGVRVCWDNFGVNSCNLNNIMKMPFDGVKVSSEIVKPFCREENHQLLYIVRMLKSRSWTVALAGVEFTDEIDMFRDLGIKYIQGNKMAGFMNESKVIEFLSDKKGGFSDGEL